MRMREKEDQEFLADALVLQEEGEVLRRLRFSLFVRREREREKEDTSPESKVRVQDTKHTWTGIRSRKIFLQGLNREQIKWRKRSMGRFLQQEKKRVSPESRFLLQPNDCHYDSQPVIRRGNRHRSRLKSPSDPLTLMEEVKERDSFRSSFSCAVWYSFFGLHHFFSLFDHFLLDIQWRREKPLQVRERERQEKKKNLKGRKGSEGNIIETGAVLTGARDERRLVCNIPLHNHHHQQQRRQEQEAFEPETLSNLVPSLGLIVSCFRKRLPLISLQDIYAYLRILSWRQDTFLRRFLFCCLCIQTNFPGIPLSIIIFGKKRRRFSRNLLLLLHSLILVFLLLSLWISTKGKEKCLVYTDCLSFVSLFLSCFCHLEFLFAPSPKEWKDWLKYNTRVRSFVWKRSVEGIQRLHWRADKKIFRWVWRRDRSKKKQHRDNMKR